MKEIPLSKGYVALVDDEDYDRLTAMGRWYFGGDGYAIRSVNYKKPNGRWSSKTIRMHRIIMNTPDGMDTDHKDTDRLNNQKSNLRICTRSQNKMNTNLRAGSTSGYKGVTWSKSRRKWGSVINLKGKTVWVGFFSDKLEAAKAYNAAALEHYGEFARLNDV